jgi:NADH:ubiquinone oxidoreductase subunit
MNVVDTFIVLREPGEARRSGWQNVVKSWYDVEQQARHEAERLCHQTGKRFVVFRAVAYVEPSAPPIEWHEYVEWQVEVARPRSAEATAEVSEVDDDPLADLPF